MSRDIELLEAMDRKLDRIESRINEQCSERHGPVDARLAALEDEIGRWRSVRLKLLAVWGLLAIIGGMAFRWAHLKVCQWLKIT